VTAPDLVHGAWGRQSVSIDNGPRFETQLVVWLQAGTRYADLRIPFHPAAEEGCFTGWSGWDGERYRWTRHLDLMGSELPSPDDVGDLTSENGVLVERGTFSTPSGPLPYEEVWVRLPGADGLWQVFESPTACLVRVGDHAITVVDGRPDGGSFAACYRIRGANGWMLQQSIGDAADLPAPGEPTPGWRTVHSGDAMVVTA